MIFQIIYKIIFKMNIKITFKNLKIKKLIKK